MKTYPSCAVIALTALLLSACGARNATRSDENAAPAPQASTEKAPAKKAVVSCIPVKTKSETKPVAKTESQAKTPAKKPVKGKVATKPAETTATAAPAPSPSTAPVSPNADGSCPAGTEAVVTQPEPAPAAAPAKAAAGNSDGSPRMVKSKDGSFEGEVYGTPTAGSKLARIQIGMTQEEVEKIMGHPSSSRSYVTGKAFNPFYFGTDAARLEWIYRGYGSVAFDAGRWGGGGVVMMINHDPKIQ
ncbi:MAG: hypothetical protein H6R19_903 [Proteobacteria bacterium]|nr:hypothetical protein [Pseudomonadota bacterium]